MDSPNPQATQSASNSLDFLAGGGEMGRLMREHDWSRSPLGPAEEWPQSLRTSVSTCLNCDFPILVWWGPELVMLYNDEYRPILGSLKHPTALGAPGKAIWPEIWNTIGPMLGQVMETGEATRSRDLLLVMDRDGYTEETYFSFSYSPIRDETGGIGGVFCPVIETTDRVLAERRLRTLTELSETAASRVKSLVEMQESCVSALQSHRADVPFALFYDLSGAAPLLVRSFGIDPGLVLPAPGSEDLLARVGSGETVMVSQLSSERPILAPCGEPVRSAVLMPIPRRDKGDVTGALVLGINPRRAYDDDYRVFTERVAGAVSSAIANARAFEIERTRAETLVEIDRTKTAFFSNVSHEFRTPLTLMLGPLEDALAEGASLPAKQREHVEVARRNALRLLKLVNSLLDFARIEAGRVEATFEPQDLAAMTADLASSFRSAAERAGLRLTVDCQPLPEPVYVDSEMWEKIVLNLISNAYKFTFEGEIAVALKAVDGAAELSVRDTGVGIPENELPRLFERFHRIEGQERRSYEGSGIGLALVQELVALNGGTIRVESSVGRGTTFTIAMPFGTAHLPADRIGAARSRSSSAVRSDAFSEEAIRWLPDAPGMSGPAPDAAAEAAPDLRGARIVVADDNADMRAYVHRLLSEGCEVEAVADGQAALEAIERRRPDLVLADVMMPRLDGFGLLKAIRTDRALHDLPVIMLSARAGEEARIEGLDAGADDYLAKPFSARELKSVVTGNLRLARTRKRESELLAGRRRILEMVATAAPLDETLDELMLFLEAQEPGMRCGILLVAEDGEHFRRGSGPNLPEHYHAALDGVPITPPYLGSCGEAAHDCTAVLIPDVETETRYAEEWRALLGACGIRACRSTPVCGSEGRALASIAMYFDHPRDPNPKNPELAEMATHLAAIAIEHHDAETALRSSEANLRLALDIGRLGIWQLDLTSMTLTASAECKANFGVGADELFDYPRLVAAIHPDDRERQANAVEEAIRKRSRFEIEYRCVTPLGAVRWVAVMGDFDSEAVGFERLVGVSQDITERKRAEAAYRDSEARLRAIFDGTFEYISLLSTAGMLLECNRPALEFAGNVREEVVGRAFWTTPWFAGTPGAAEKVREAIGRAAAGEFVRYEAPLLRPSGEVVTLDFSLHPVRDAAGAVTLIVAEGRNITARKEAEVELRESQRRLKTLVEGIPQLVWRAVGAGRWIWASRQWTDFTGQSEGDSHGVGWLEMLHPDDQTGARQAWERAEATGGFEMNGRIRCKDGTYRWFQTRATPIRNESGMIVEWFGTSTDVDDLYRLRQQQEVLVSELQHRTRNLLAVVRSIASQTMATTPSPERFSRSFNDRLEALSRVQGLLSRSEREPITIGTLVHTEMASLGAEMFTDRMVIEGPPVQLPNAAVQTLSLALHELATNARKYGALANGHGRLTVRWTIEPAADGRRALVLRWLEEGGEPFAPEQAGGSGGYGRKLIERALPYALGAETSYELDEAGVRCAIRIPLAEED